MKEKIDWYQEVLELEPGSKVFFPLARLLAESGQTDKAVSTLRQGLDRHPEFIEARLFLIDLLFRTGRADMCGQQMSLLEPLFKRYIGFWNAWSNSLAATDKDRDTGLALAFLAASFQKGTLSLSDVLARGIQSTLESPQVPSATGSEVEPAPEAPSRNDDIDMDSLPPPAVIELARTLGSGTQHAQHNAVSEDDSEDPDERFSLRTRSMAEVLAEQGDYSGALEIYQELSTAAASSEEAADLQQRIATLTAHLGTVQEHSAEPAEESFTGKRRVLTALEALAERLEARVHG